MLTGCKFILMKVRFMEKAETLMQYYQRLPFANPDHLSGNNAGPGHFNVFVRGTSNKNTPFSRRDFYKVSLILSTGNLHYANKWIAIDRPALMLSTPLFPYSCKADSLEQEGWFCIFTSTFIHPFDFKHLVQESPLFIAGGEHLFFLEPEQLELITNIFKKMITEIHSEYRQKYDVLRNYLYILIHEALKMRPADNYKRPAKASQRTTALFFELLERQFPVDKNRPVLTLRKASDYAQALSISSDHLNHILKATTGRTTTQHITLRIIKEAYTLLQHQDWTI